MNYYNPYYLAGPVTSQLSSGAGLFSRFNFGTILNGIQRTLGLVNQALPLIKEAAPMMRNAKTMFKVMNEFKKIDVPSDNHSTVSSADSSNELNNNISNERVSYNSGGPTFFA